MSLARTVTPPQTARVPDGGRRDRLGPLTLLAPLSRVAAIIACAAFLASCARPPSPLDKALTVAASPTGGRAAAAVELATAWRAKAITFDEAIEFASAHLEAVANATAPNAAASSEATLFAGAVLDAMVTTRAEFPKDVDLTIFWIKVGRLAFRAAEEAHAAGRLQDAAALVEAGPRDWQKDAYWHLYPDHDALAAVIMAQGGQPFEAMRRLESRVELRGPAEEVLTMLRAQQPR